MEGFTERPSGRIELSRRTSLPRCPENHVIGGSLHRPRVDQSSPGGSMPDLARRNHGLLYLSYSLEEGGAILEFPSSGGHSSGPHRETRSSPLETQRNDRLPYLRYLLQDEVAVLEHPGFNGGHLSAHPREIRVFPELTPRSPSLPYLRYMPEDEAAIVEFPSLNGGPFAGRHQRETRLGMNNVPYEALLALRGRVGRVKTGLTEEAILGHLRTRIYVSSATDTRSEDASCVHRESNFCVICQAVFQDQQTIALLECEHVYHADCLKEWLMEKNKCPMCKSTALDLTD